MRQPEHDLNTAFSVQSQYRSANRGTQYDGSQSEDDFTYENVFLSRSVIQVWY